MLDGSSTTDPTSRGNTFVWYLTAVNDLAAQSPVMSLVNSSGYVHRESCGRRVPRFACPRILSRCVRFLIRYTPPQRPSVLNIPPELLSPGAVYRITLNVTSNFLSTSSSISQQVAVANAVLPSVTIDGDAAFNTTVDATLSLHAKGLAPVTCSGFSGPPSPGGGGANAPSA